MDELLQNYEKLKKIYALINYDQYELPSIIIIGDQQSGKSSLLENIIGCSFLPKETRCPIEIVVVKKENSDIPDWAVFLTAPTCLITDFNHVRHQIEIETNKRLNFDKTVSAEPIQIRIHSNKFLNLSIVDLPGLRKKTVQKQLEEEKELNDITINYISNKNTVILVAVAAGKDLISMYNSSEALKLAKMEDPEGLRTIVVLTKLDFIEQQPTLSKHISDIFTGQIKPASLNITGIINGNKCQKDENSFLMKYYPVIANRLGMPQLIMFIYRLFLQTFTEYLPKLRENVNLSYWRYKHALVNLGEPIEDYYRTMLGTISNFTLAYTSTILGPYKELETKELTAGARINYIFREIFGQTIREINPLRGFNKTTLLTVIRNASGVKSTIFIPDVCFELLIKKEIQKLETPSLRCVQLVVEEMERLVYNCGPAINSQLHRFPKLRQTIVTTVLDLIKSRVNSTNEMVKDLINIHTAYINTAHPDFLQESRRYDNFQPYELCIPNYDCQEVVAFQGGDSLHSRTIEDTSKECIIVERLITSYFNVVRTAIEDCVPKTIMHFLVNYIVENVQSELVAKLFSDGLPEKELMAESENIVKERKRTVELIRNHYKAINLTSEISESLNISFNKPQ